MAVVPIISQLVRAFNLQNVRVPDARNNPYNQDTVSNKFLLPDEKLYTSALGTPVFADVTLWGNLPVPKEYTPNMVAGKYTDNITGKEVTFPVLKYDAVILTVNFVSRIIKTEIQGRDGTVKEYIGQDDAKITIQGIICGWNGHYPAFEVAQLNEWRKAPVAKNVTSTFLQNLGIDSLVVESCDLPQIAGGYSYQTFTIQCISDSPVELKISN